MKTTLTDKRYRDQAVYNIEGDMDYDIITNSVDYIGDYVGKPKPATQ